MTLQKIAKKAGVSMTTVHRVLKGKGEVSPKTADRILKIIRDSGYSKQPGSQVINNHFHKSFFKTGSIGVLLVHLPVELIKVPLIAKLISEIEKKLASYELMMTVMQISGAREKYPMITSDRLDGLILLGDHTSDFLRDRFQSMHAVGVLGTEHDDLAWADWVSSNYQLRGRLAVKYLQERGHRRVAYFNPMANHLGFVEVGLEFNVCALRAGLEPIVLRSEQIFPGRMWRDIEGQVFVRELIDRFMAIPMEKRPTGLHVANDEIAVSVYRELKKRAIEPGRDVEIIACGNDEEFLVKMEPRPATMDLNVPEIARWAVEKLIYRITNPDALAGITVLVPPRLVLPDVNC